MHLGLDIGTTNAKALVLDNEGNVLGLGVVPVQVQFIGDEGVEQDIEDIWGATLKAIRAAGAQTDLSAVQAVGVSSQGGAIQLRRPDGACVGPVVSWMDQRGGPVNRELAADLGGSIFRLVQEVTGTRDLSGYGVDALMEQVPSGCDGLRMSLESGKNDYETFSFDGATVTGLHFKHGRAHLLRAALEGLARSLALRAHWFEKAGAPIKRLMATGGAASSRVTPQVIATTLQVPVESVEGEISARGAAMLACALSGGGIPHRHHRANGRPPPRRGAWIRKRPEQAGVPRGDEVQTVVQLPRFCLTSSNRA